VTWLYMPGISPASALEPEDWTLESDSPFHRLAASCSWRGKPRQPQSWFIVWKRVTWLRRLSGLTLPPSTLSRGADAFIASLPEIPANPTASRANRPAQTTSGFSSIKWCASSMSAGLSVSSEKTSRGTLLGSSPLSSRHWSDWATALRLEYSVRPKPGIATGESDLSSWQTPMASDDGQKATLASHQLMLCNQVRFWTTACLSSLLLDRGIFEGGLRLLNSDQTSPPYLEGGETSMWPSPMASVVDVDSMERMRTPGYVRKAQKEDGQPYLAQVSGVLNPGFVEWLMRWPIGWTDFGCSETGSTLWRQRMRGYVLTLLTARIASDRQGSLL